MKSKSLSIGLILIVAVAAGAYFWPRGESASADDFRTARVKRTQMSRDVLATGVIRPVVGAEINVGSRVSGIVDKMAVKIGDTVEAGDLLAQIDDTEFQARLRQAEANITLAEAQLALARSTLQRQLNLRDQGFGSAADLDAAERDVDVGEAQLQLSKARLLSAQIDLGYTRIAAPIGGVIAEVTTREGETVAASFTAPTFVTIIDLGRLEVQAYVDETDIGRIYLGQEAAFMVDTYPDAEFTARVTAINPKPEIQNSVVNYIVVLNFDGETEQTLRPEMTAHVRLNLDSRDDVLTVPRRAVRRKQGAQYVMVRGECTMGRAAYQCRLAVGIRHRGCRGTR